MPILQVKQWDILTENILFWKGWRHFVESYQSNEQKTTEANF